LENKEQNFLGHFSQMSVTKQEVADNDKKASESWGLSGTLSAL
jgi:hypothetical protein